MRKIRVWGWFISSLYMRHRLKIITGFFVGVILVLFVTRFQTLFSKNLAQKSQIIGMVGQYTPSDLPLSVQHLISTGLTSVDSNGLPLPSLSTSWIVNEAGNEYVFTLRNDIYWHDGRKFTAFDINYNLKDVVFEPLSESEIKVILKEPFSPLPNFLSKPLFQKGLIGIGPYKVDAIRLKGEFVSYLRLVPLLTDAPILEIKFYQGENQAKIAFKLGEVSILDEIGQVSEFTSWQTLDIKENKKNNQHIVLFFNLEKPIFDTKEIRQALSYATKKDERRRIASPLSTESWAYTNQVKHYEYDIDEAKKILGNTSLKEEIVLSTFANLESLAHEIKADWEALGLTVTVKVETSFPDDYQTFLLLQEIPSDPDQYNLWHSTQKETNISHYANAKIDKLLEDGRKESDIEKRKEIYFDFQRYLVDDAPAIFFHFPVTYTVTKK